MEHIRVAKVENVSILHHGQSEPGTLHLTAHHLIFKRKQAKPEAEQEKKAPPNEIWIAYPIISTAHRYAPSAAAPAHIRLRNRDFSFVQFRFETDRECRDVFESIKDLTVIKGGVEKLYAFYYQPGAAERRCNGWEVYDPVKEFQRMGVGTEKCRGWRFSTINKDYSFSPTYPATLVVPATISDTTLMHAKKYRSRARIPALTYLHPLNNCCIARCSQPLTGLRGNRSIQDEKLVAAIFASSQPPGSFQTPDYLRNNTPSPSASSTSLSEVDACATSASAEPDARIYGAQQRNLIVDARPTLNAYAMQAMGMGSEDMDNYRHTSSPPCTKVFLGIDNIHVMRDSLQKVVEAIKDSDITPMPPNRELLAKSKWLNHIGLLLDGSAIIVRQIAVEHAHVLLHCSDGWDRTSQLSSLAQICLDPYYRTIDGFMALVEKDWVAFGHRFRDRSGFLGHDKWFVEKSGFGQPQQEESFGDDEESSLTPTRTNTNTGDFLSNPTASSAAALGGALVGSAKNFFSNVSNGSNRAPSPNPDVDDDPNSTNIDRRTRAARNIETPQVTKPKEVSPMFQQFLDGTYQLMAQYPTRFEYNERFLRRLLFHLYSCQYGTFLHNNDKERYDSRVKERTRSVWDYFLARRKMWLNERYDPTVDGNEREVEGGRVIFPKPGTVKWWAACWGREDADMNGQPMETGTQTGTGPLDTREISPSQGGAALGATGVAVGGVSRQEFASSVNSVMEGMKGLAMGKGGVTSGRGKREQEEMGVEMM